MFEVDVCSTFWKCIPEIDCCSTYRSTFGSAPLIKRMTLIYINPRPTESITEKTSLASVRIRHIGRIRHSSRIRHSGWGPSPAARLLTCVAGCVGKDGSGEVDFEVDF